MSMYGKEVVKFGGLEAVDRNLIPIDPVNVGVNEILRSLSIAFKDHSCYLDSPTKEI